MAHFYVFDGHNLMFRRLFHLDRSPRIEDANFRHDNAGNDRKDAGGIWREPQGEL